MNPTNYLVCKPVGDHEIEIGSEVYTVLFDQYNSLGFHHATVNRFRPHHFQDGSDPDSLKQELNNTFSVKFPDILLDVSGSLAIEHAIQYAQLYTKKEKVLTYRGCYHGSTIAIKKLVEDCVSLPHCSEDALVDVPEFSYEASMVEITDRLSTSSYSCILIDPNFCDHFIEVPVWYWKQLRKLCDQWGVFLVLDEMRTGFRSEKMWFLNELPITIDVLVGAKALSNGLPFSLTAISEFAYERDLAHSVHKRCTGFSYNPFIIANSRVVLSKIYNLYKTPENISSVFRNAAEYYNSACDQIQLTPRGYGLIIAIRSPRGVAIAELCEAKLKSERILVYRSQNKFILYPHFNMDPQQVKDIVDKFIAIVDDTLKERALG